MHSEKIKTYLEFAEVGIKRFEEEYLSTALHVTFTKTRTYTNQTKSKSKKKRFRDFSVDLLEAYLHTAEADPFFISGYAPIMFWTELTNRISALHFLTQSLPEEEKTMFEFCSLRVKSEPAQRKHFEAAKEFMLKEYWKLDTEHGIDTRIHMLEPKEIEP